MALLRVWIRLHLRWAGNTREVHMLQRMFAACKVSTFLALVLCLAFTLPRTWPASASQCRQSYTYPVWTAMLLLSVVGRCQNHLGRFLWTRIVENRRFAVGISTLSIVVPDIWVLPVWAVILLLPRLSVVVTIIRGHFLWTRGNRKSYGCRSKRPHYSFFYLNMSGLFDCQAQHVYIKREAQYDGLTDSTTRRGVHYRGKYRGDLSNRWRFIWRIFNFSKLLSFAISNFHKWQILTVYRVKRVNMHYQHESPYQISCRSVEPLPKYGDFSIFQYGGHLPSWIF